MKNKKQFLGVFFSVLICIFVVCAIVYATTTIGNDVTVGGILTISDVNQNDQIGITSSISADTDGDTVYGLYQEVDTGTGVLSSGNRISAGIYQEIINNSDIDPAWTYSLDYSIGLQQKFTAGDDASTYKQVYGIWQSNSDYTSTGNNFDLTGIYQNVFLDGTGSIADLVYSRLFLKNDDGVTQTGDILYGYFGSAGAGDAIYGVRLVDIDSGITGGTAYGINIDIDDTDWTTAYSIYVNNGSAISYFGNATSSFGGDVEIGNAAAGHLGADTENLYVEGILEVDGTAHFDGLVSVSDANGILLGDGVTFMTGVTSQSAACVKGSIYINSALGNISICDEVGNWTPIATQ